MRGHRKDGAEHPRRLPQNRTGHRTAIRSKERETSLAEDRSIREKPGIYIARDRGRCTSERSGRARLVTSGHRANLPSQWL